MKVGGVEWYGMVGMCGGTLYIETGDPTYISDTHRVIHISTDSQSNTHTIHRVTPLSLTEQHQHTYHSQSNTHTHITHKDQLQPRPLYTENLFKYPRFI